MTTNPYRPISDLTIGELMDVIEATMDRRAARLHAESEACKGGDQRKVRIAIADNPGVGRGDLTRLTGVYGAGLTRAIQALEAESIIRVERNNRHTHYPFDWEEIVPVVP